MCALWIAYFFLRFEDVATLVRGDSLRFAAGDEVDGLAPTSSFTTDTARFLSSSVVVLGKGSFGLDSLLSLLHTVDSSFVGVLSIVLLLLLLLPVAALFF